jgi:hypothetical protein
MEARDLEHLAELLAEVRRQCRYVYEFDKCSYAYQALAAALNAGRMVETLIDRKVSGKKISMKASCAPASTK